MLPHSAAHEAFRRWSSGEAIALAHAPRATRDTRACSPRAVDEDAAMPLLDGLQVVNSKIHGYGVVTTRPFRQGDVICFGDGVLYDDDAEFDDTYALIFPGDDTSNGEPLFWDLVCQTRWFN